MPRRLTSSREVAERKSTTATAKLYGFERHYLGNGTIIYRAMVEDAGREFRGELSGEFDHLSGGLVPARVEPLVRAAIRKSTGFRP